MKRILSLILCAVLAASFLCWSSASADDVMFNDGADHVVDGPVDGGVVANGEGTSVTVEGAVVTADTAPGGHDNVAVTAYDGSTVTVNGDVKGEVIASHSSEVTIEGSVTNPSTFEGLTEEDGDMRYADSSVSSIYGSTVTVNGDVNGGTVTAQHNSDLTIDGDLISDNYGVYAANHSDVTVTGSVSAEYDAVRVKNDDTVFVGGDVVSKDEGVRVFIDPHPYDPYGDESSDGNGNSKLTVLGTVESASESFVVDIAPELNVENDEWSWLSKEEVIAALPEIIVQALKPGGDFAAVNAEPFEYTSMVDGSTVSVDSGYTELDKKAIAEALLSKINYIVNQDNVDTATISVMGTSEEDGHVVAKETQKIILKSNDSGYVLTNVSAGDYADIQQNDDGSYSILVNRGGDLRLFANVIARPAPANPSQAQTDSAQTYSVPTASGGNNGATSTDYGYLQSYEPIYADYANQTLVIDLAVDNYTAMLRSTIQKFQKNGFRTILINTKAGTYTMTMDELLSLTEGGIAITFYAHAAILNLYLDSAPLITFSMSSAT